MTKRIVIIQGHPDPDPRRLCRALAEAYAEGAAAAGHVIITRVDLATLDFPLLRTQDAFEHGALPAGLAAAQQAIQNADHLVLIFPLWLGTMPALVKAFLEQVMRPGTAFAYRASGFPEKLLAGRSARVVVTMGMPVFAYRWWFMGHGIKGLERSILRFVGIKPIRESLFGMVANASESRRQRWLARMREFGCKAI